MHYVDIFNKNLGPIRIHYGFEKGLYISIEAAAQDAIYTVIFTDKDTDTILYETNIDGNSWAHCKPVYYIKWNVKVVYQGELIWEHTLNLEGKKVKITLDSGSLGDTLGWMPYAEEFRKKHNCIVYLGTYQHVYNDLFFSNKYYPHLNFIKPDETVEDIYTSYSIGAYYNKTNTGHNPAHHKRTFIGLAHQQICTDILGLPYKEIKPLIDERPRTPKKQVCISIFSTAQAKFWNNETGWQEVVDYLNKQGYIVKLLGREPDEFMGNKIPNGVIRPYSGDNFQIVIDELRDSELFIGIGSGISWLAWALNVPVILVSGFSEPHTEMQSNCIRIKARHNSCSGCYNKHLFDRGDWLWCPEHKNTSRWFECTRKITGTMIINKIKTQLGL
jgi:autotransporter strand-loop-strand O-heptosyltransferase